jgi:hypothetical protein
MTYKHARILKRPPLLALLAATIAGCGGGGGAPVDGADPADAATSDGAPGGSGDGAADLVPDAPAPALGALTQTITPAGGTMRVRGLEGGLLVLEFPAGAVRRSVAVTVTSVVARPGAVAEAQIAPAGLVLFAPAKLRYTAASPLPPRPHFFWTNKAELNAVATRETGGALEAELGTFGYGAPAPKSPRHHAAGDATLVLTALECDAKITALNVRLGQAANNQDLDQAQALFDELEAVTVACGDQRRTEIEGAACKAYEAAAVNAAAIAADSYETFRQITVPLMATLANLQLAGATCDTSQHDALFRQKFDQLTDFLRVGVDKPGFADELLDRRLGELLTYHAHCQLSGLTDVCDGFAQRLYPKVLDLMRAAAYRDCTTEGSALAVSQLYGLGREAGAQGPFFGFANYSYVQLEDDLTHCTGPKWIVKVFSNASGTPELVADLGKEHDSRGGLGAPANTLEVTVPRQGSLTVGGTVRALVCPHAALASDELVFKIRDAELTRRPRSANLFGIDVNAADIDVARDLPRAGLDPATAASFVVDVLREGDGCGGTFTSAFKVLTITVSLGRPALTLSPSSADLLPGQTQSFSANLGGSPTDAVTWGATGGSISGTGVYTAGTAVGTFAVTATSKTDPTLSAKAEVRIRKDAQVVWTGKWTLDYTFKVSWSRSGSDVGSCAGDPACTATEAGSYDGSLHVDATATTLTAVLPGSTADFFIQDPAAAGSATGASSFTFSQHKADCSQQASGTGSSALTTTSSAKGVWKHLVLAGGGIELQQPAPRPTLTYEGTAKSQARSQQSEACPGGVMDETEVNPPSKAIPVKFLLQNNKLLGTDTVTASSWQGKASSQLSGTTECNRELFAGNLTETPVKGPATCQATVTVTWELHPQP